MNRSSSIHGYLLAHPRVDIPTTVKQDVTDPESQKLIGKSLTYHGISARQPAHTILAVVSIEGDEKNITRVPATDLNLAITYRCGMCRSTWVAGFESGAMTCRQCGRTRSGEIIGIKELVGDDGAGDDMGNGNDDGNSDSSDDSDSTDEQNMDNMPEPEPEPLVPLPQKTVRAQYNRYKKGGKQSKSKLSQSKSNGYGGAQK